MTVGTPYSIRNNEFYGDLEVWRAVNASDNGADMRRLRRNLRTAREAELTPRQRQMLHLYYDCNMNMSEIGRVLGVHKSTVSRTITRAKTRLYRALSYTI